MALAADTRSSDRPLALAALTIAVLAWLGLLAARATAPSDMLTRDQERVATYVLDITERGNWIVQHDIWGQVASKPPVFNWLAAAAVSVAGDAGRVVIAWPSWFASLIVVLLVFGIVRSIRGPVAGAFAVFLYLYSQLGLRQVLLVRTDTAFQLFVFLGVLAGWRAWQRGGRGVWMVWVALVLASLTKAPHAFLFGTVGWVAAAPGLRPAGQRPLRLAAWREHAVGLLALVAGVGWFSAAVVVGGDAVTDKLLGDELAGHVLDDHGQVFGEGFLLSSAWFLTRLAPVSLLCIAAFVRIFRQRSDCDSDPRQRAFERYLTAHVLGVLVLISLGSKVRFVHLLPLMPAAAILGGFQLDLLMSRFRVASRLRLAAAVALVSVAGAFLYLHVVDAPSPPLVAGERIAAFADRVADRFDPARDVRIYLPEASMRRAGAGRPLTGVLQYHWQTFVEPIRDPVRAEAFLRDADRALVVADVDQVGSPSLDAFVELERVEIPHGVAGDGVTRISLIGSAEPRRTRSVAVARVWRFALLGILTAVGAVVVGRFAMRVDVLGEATS